MCLPHISWEFSMQKILFCVCLFSWEHSLILWFSQMCIKAFVKIYKYLSYKQKFTWEN